MKIGNIEVQLILDKAKFTRAITAAKLQLRKFLLKAQGLMRGLGSAVSAVASKFKLLLVAGIAAAGIAVWKAVSTFATFEKQMASVGTMLSGTARKLLPAYAQGIRKLSVAIGESTETLSKGLYNVLSATIPPTQAMKVLELAAKGAAGGMTTTDVAVTALTKSMLQYKELAPEVIMDTLAAAVERGYFTFGELAGAMPGVLALGKSSNVAFGELSGTMAFLSKRFATVSEAGTALEGLLKAIKIPTGRYKDALDTMGITAKEVQNRIGKEGLQGGLKWLIDKAENVGLSVDTMFRRKEAMLAITAMSKGMEDWKVDIDLVTDSAGTMQRKYKDMQKTLSFQMNRLKKGFTDAFRVAGMQLSPVIKEFVDKLINNLPNIINYAKKVGFEFAGWFRWISASAKSGALRYIWKALGFVYEKVKMAYINFQALGIYLKGAFLITIQKIKLALLETVTAIPIIGKRLGQGLRDDIEQTHQKIQELNNQRVEGLTKLGEKEDEYLEHWKESEEGKVLTVEETLAIMGELDEADTQGKKEQLGVRLMDFDNYMFHLRTTKKTGFEKDQEQLKETLTNEQKYLLTMLKQEKTTFDTVMEIHNITFNALSKGFEDAFMNIGKKGYQFGDFLGGIWKSIYSGFAKMVAKMIAKWLALKVMKSIFGLGFFQKGINYVPFDMLAYVHKGEKITPASGNQSQNYNMGGITLNLNVGSMTPADVEPIATQLVEAIKNKLPSALSLSKEMYGAGGELVGEA